MHSLVFLIYIPCCQQGNNLVNQHLHLNSYRFEENNFAELQSLHHVKIERTQMHMTGDMRRQLHQGTKTGQFNVLRRNLLLKTKMPSACPNSTEFVA